MNTDVLPSARAYAIDEIAHLLHVHQQIVAMLSTRKERPLPLPPESDQDEAALSASYLRHLRRWLRQEKTQAVPPRLLDFKRIEHDLLMAMDNIAGYDFVKEYPPGYFLG